MINQSIPAYVTKYFWGDDLQDLNFSKHKKYIIQVLLEKGDQKAIKWLLSKEDTKTIKELLPNIRLTDKSAHFWKIYFS